MRNAAFCIEEGPHTNSARTLNSTEVGCMQLIHCRRASVSFRPSVTLGTLVHWLRQRVY